MESFGLCQSDGAIQQQGTLEFDQADPTRSSVRVGLYVPQVSDQVQIHITAEAAEKNAYEQYLKARAAREAAKKS